MPLTKAKDILRKVYHYLLKIMLEQFVGATLNIASIYMRQWCGGGPGGGI